MGLVLLSALERLWHIWGRLRETVETSLAHLERLWHVWGCLWETLETSLAHLGPSLGGLWEALGTPLGRLGDAFGTPWNTNPKKASPIIFHGAKKWLNQCKGCQFSHVTKARDRD